MISDKKLGALVGGCGSGSWPRGFRRESLDGRFAIDVRQWKREGLLVPRALFETSWGVSGRVLRGILVHVGDDEIILARDHPVGLGMRDARVRIGLSYTPCHFGGRRVWFKCPSCEQRSAKLYDGGSPDFACRKCCRLPYRCQGETGAHRAGRRAHKLRARLGASHDLADPVSHKPRGMHWRSFERLRVQSDRAEAMYWFLRDERVDCLLRRTLRLIMP